MISRVLQGVNVPACYFETCCLLFSFVDFLITWKGCLLIETSFIKTTSSRSVSMWSKSAVPKEGCLDAPSDAECCCRLRSRDKPPIKLSCLQAELRL